ncbi:diguanylate cyclase domain-containing protein [endosymbiont of Lamellibrachia barhami]|uniref:diguanylate cyclase domain-containing protein n=1 Tax=endosymbiont of Lamellibrachia barhami TaxID=205975 RepID=UPI0015B2DBA2|nr:diguanylate cyclase [endosymbiont of Lamellibrachia barhami]
MIAIDYMANADSRFSFAEETEDSQHLSPDDTHPWKILVVDDEEDIHQVTRMVLGDYHYLGRPVFIIDAYSSEQAIEVMREHPDVALILLDVIMESDTAGLELVEVVRNKLGNSDVRIFIRTGQPGMFNQYQIAAQYNINDFKDKANLTIEKLFASITTLLREYSGLQEMRQQHENLQKDIDQLKALAGLFQETSLATLVLDDQYRIKAVNPAFEKVTGFSAEYSIGRRADFLKSNNNDETILNAAWKNLLDSGSWEGELWCATKFLNDINIRLSASVVKITDQHHREIAIQFSDITDIKEQERQLLERATRDPLTALPNRNLFLDRLENAVSLSERGGQSFALLFIDLDYFKSVNDRLGHKYGDQLLIEVAARLNQCLRRSDTVARVGGDEFTAVVTNTINCTHIEIITKKINAAIAKPFDLDGKKVCITCSIGISRYPHDAQDIKYLLHAADLAMYHAKQKGRNTYSFFLPEMDGDTTDEAGKEVGS